MQNTQPGPWEGGRRVERDIFPRKSSVRNATKPYLLFVESELKKASVQETVHLINEENETILEFLCHLQFFTQNIDIIPWFSLDIIRNRLGQVY